MIFITANKAGTAMPSLLRAHVGQLKNYSSVIRGRVEPEGAFSCIFSCSSINSLHGRGASFWALGDRWWREALRCHFTCPVGTCFHKHVWGVWALGRHHPSVCTFPARTFTTLRNAMNSFVSFDLQVLGLALYALSIHVHVGCWYGFPATARHVHRSP